VCVFVSLFFFSLSIRTLNIAIVYSIWSGTGITLVTALAWKIHGQRIDLPAIVGIGLIITGVLVINLYSATVRSNEANSPILDTQSSLPDL
jgi:small multidrug resistance pump